MKPDSFLAHATSALRGLRARWQHGLAGLGEVHAREEPFPQDHNFVMRVSVLWTTRGHTFVLTALLDIPAQSIHFSAGRDGGATALLKPAHPRECRDELADSALAAFHRWVAGHLGE